MLAQAHVMGRSYVGLDLSTDYKQMFEDRVLPAIRALHEENRENARRAEERKRRFKDLIRSLRKIKYPKELVRLYRKSHGNVQIEAIIALQDSNLASDRLNIIFLFPRSAQVPPAFLPRTTELCQQPPLSKYGIEPMLKAYPADVVSREWLRHKGVDLHQPLYVYLKGRTYAWTQSLSVDGGIDFFDDDQRLQSLNQRYPPVVSNIAVKVNPKSPVVSIEEENE